MIFSRVKSFLVYLCFSSCIKLAPVKIPENEFIFLTDQQNQSHPIDLGDPRCTYGGILLTSWTDQKIIDGIYTEGQDKDYTEKVVCFLLPAINNSTTLAKPGDFKNIVTDVLVGDSDCPQGGKKYESFIDVNGNSTYDSTIDTQYNSNKICNGINGTASLSGGNARVISTMINAGDLQCPTGGTKIELFVDANGNGIYDASVDTFHSIKYLCNGSDSVTIAKTLAIGDSTCPSGGTQLNTFTDINHNGTYEPTVDKNSNTYKVCHGQKALVFSTALTSADTSCPGGGTQLVTCVDSNNDSNCTSGTDLNYAVKKICNGSGAGFLIVNETAGSNCRSGGYRLDRFQDNNNNAVYDVGIDTGYTSTYVCNGLNWLSKSTSFTAGNGTAADNSGCLLGGVRFEFGYDHVNASNGTYNIGIDGVLDTVEVISSVTAYACNGISNQAGPLISTFQNDSEGTNARFYWETITGDGAAPIIKLAYSSTKVAIQAWNCESSLAGVTVVTDFSSCTDTTYRTASSGTLNARAKCGFDLTIAPFSTSPWDYRYFKLCAQNSTNLNNQTITSFRVAGNVPSGMVMVHQDDWPIHEFANTVITPFTYAIDKWEPYLSGGSITNGTPGVCTSSNCISSSTGVLSSATAQAQVQSIDWYASRKGCANRTAAGYTGANTLRTIHLQTEMENFVANYGTPDGQDATIGGGTQATGNGAIYGIITSGYLGCNTDLGHDYTQTTFGILSQYYQTGDTATKNCISRYGARDLIGNYGELFDGYYENMNNNTTRQRSVYWGTADKVTTAISDALLGYAFPTATQALSVSDWDYQNLLPKPPYAALVAPSQKYFSDVCNIEPNAAAPIIAAQFYSASIKGSGSYAGRFNKDIGNYQTNVNTFSSGALPRCAITSP